MIAIKVSGWKVISRKKERGTTWREGGARTVFEAVSWRVRRPSKRRVRQGTARTEWRKEQSGTSVMVRLIKAWDSGISSQRRTKCEEERVSFVSRVKWN